MPTINLKDFSVGLITQPSETDIALEAMTLAENVDLTDFGKKRKQRGYLGSAGPSGITIKSFYKMEFSKPSTKIVTFVYGTDGAGRDTIWQKPYLTFGDVLPVVAPAWVDAWQEITEFEGPYVASNIAGGAAGDTDTNDIYDLSSLLSAVDNYYNGWTVLNITRQWTQVVQNYDGANRRLQLNGIVTAQTVGDTYFLYRHPIVKSLEGAYTIDTGTTTSIIDTELKAESDDFYVGWQVVNLGPGGSGTALVTGYDAQDKTLIHPTIAGQTDGDSYYLYKDTHDIGVQAGEVVRFFGRENAIEMSMGNGDSYPKVAPLWFGYVERKYFGSVLVTVENIEYNNFFLCQNVISKPDSNIITLVDGAAGTLADVTWYVKVAFVYDGYQEGPLSDAVSRDMSASANLLRIQTRLPLLYSNNVNGSGLHEAILNKRVTHIRIYVAKDDAGDDLGDYFLVRQIPIDITANKSKNGAGYWNEIIPAEYFVNTDVMELSDAIWAGTTTEDFGKKASAFGKYAKWHVNQGHKAERVDANYKFKATLQEQHFKAPIYSDEKRDAFVGFSVQANGSGVPVDDVIPVENYLNFSQKGATQITGVASVAGFIVIFSPEKTFQYAPGQYLIEVNKKGNIAKNGFVEVGEAEEAGSKIYFTGKDDIYSYDGSQFLRLMFGRILDQWQAVSTDDKKNTLMHYFELTNSLWVLAGGTMFIYNIDYGHWKTYTSGLTFVWMAQGVDGELFAATTSDIYELEATAFTQSLVMHTKSKIIDFVKEVGGRRIPTRANVKKIIVKHTGVSNLLYKIFDPSVSTVHPRKTVKFFSNSKGKPQVRDLNFEARQIQVDMVEEAGGGSQPTHEIDYEQIEYEVLGS